MACFLLDIGGTNYTISSPYIPESGELTDRLFVESLKHAVESSPGLLKSMMNSLKEAEKQGYKPLNRTQDRDVVWAIKDNLERLGVQMEVHPDQASWDKLNQENNNTLNPNAEACLLNGVIHVRQDKFKVSHAMHEFTHLILAYLKNTNYRKYQEFLNTMKSNPVVQKRISELQGNYATYLDMVEEAVVEFIDSWFDENNPVDVSKAVVYHYGTQYDATSYVGKALSKPISELFGLNSQLEAMSFFKSLLLDIGQYGCELFTGHVLPTSGYSIQKDKVIKAQQTKALIEWLTATNKIKQIEC